MDRFAAMQSFRWVVERGGFAAGAKALGLSKATVSKQVSVLEAHLGTALLQRTTRRLSLTEAGQGFYADTVRILDDVAGAETQVAEGHADPRGLLRINAPLSFGVSRLIPVVSRFMNAYPKMRIDLALDDRTVDPVGRRSTSHCVSAPRSRTANSSPGESAGSRIRCVLRPTIPHRRRPKVRRFLELLIERRDSLTDPEL